MIKCRFCDWNTPLFVGRKSGWARLASHVVDRHPSVKTRAALVAWGTTAKGVDAVLRTKAEAQ